MQAILVALGQGANTDMLLIALRFLAINQN